MISPLLQLWLITQVDGVDALTIQINSTNRELLQGKIPQGIVAGKNVKYRGLVITSIHLEAASIYLNIPSLIRGEPLKLLNPIAVRLKATADREHLSQSLQSELVTNRIGYRLRPDLSDGEIRAVLLEMLTSLGEEVTIDRLEIDDGRLYCEAQFPIKAT
ncbi:MAG: DUF2993 domain-containing protein [Cyanobacteria bacterium M5B4]|nr:MAG: DUF2993 domain-containing protein [Cyanobacteria bacterium M5B4]